MTEASGGRPGRDDAVRAGAGARAPRDDEPLDSAQRGRGPFLWRFNRVHRGLHAAVMVSFFLLVLTGLPLRFSCTPWAEPLIRFFGGVEMAGLLHRIGGVVTFGYFFVNLVYIVVSLIRDPDRKRHLWGSDSLVPQPRDVVDFYRQFKWFLGLGPRPRFGRYSYMEKLDYLAVFWGVAIIGTSGLFLWFPEFFARFVPGWAFNVAAVVHADEAILATLFIFTIHFFNVHLRPEKFPLDAVMFTGRATMDYMEEEHPETAERIVARGRGTVERRPKIDAEAPAPSRLASVTGAVFGFLALGLGMLTIGMMLWALLC